MRNASSMSVFPTQLASPPDVPQRQKQGDVGEQEGLARAVRTPEDVYWPQDVGTAIAPWPEPVSADVRVGAYCKVVNKGQERHPFSPKPWQQTSQYHSSPTIYLHNRMDQYGI